MTYPANRKSPHGHAKGVMSPTYQTWHMMKQRCSNPKNKYYYNYGGRGITVCDRWLKFENFLADMGERPEGLTLERKDNSKGYEPDNCVWATRMQQARNTRQNRWLTLNGRTMILGDWAKEIGIKQHTLIQRIDKLGWSLEEALSTPPVECGNRVRRKEVETV